MTRPARYVLLRASALLGVLLSIGLQAMAQDASRAPKKQPKPGKAPQNEVINLPNYDSRKFHFGFFLAINYGGFRAKHSDFFNKQLYDTARHNGYPGPKPRFGSINPVQTPGFTTGFIISMRLGDQLDLRFHPAVSFYQRTVEYTWLDSMKNGDPVTDVELSTATFSFIETPILFKYKSVRRKNARMFVTGGIKPGFEVGSKRKEISDSHLRTNSFDCAIEYGFGVDLYYPLFKFSPEVRFSHGLMNMAYNDNNPYRNSLARLYTHTVTFYFNFN